MIQTIHTDEYKHNQFFERHPTGGFDADDVMTKHKTSDGKVLSPRSITEDEQLVGSVQILFFPVLAIGYTIAYIPPWICNRLRAIRLC